MKEEYPIGQKFIREQTKTPDRVWFYNNQGWSGVKDKKEDGVWGSKFGEVHRRLDFA